MTKIEVSSQRLSELSLLKIEGETTTAFILKTTEAGYKVKEIATFLNKPYREVFGTIWRKKNNYKQPKKAKVQIEGFDPIALGA